MIPELQELDTLSPDELSKAVRQLNETIAQLPVRGGPILEAAGYRRMSGKATWKRTFPDHHVTLSFRQFRWVRGTLQWKVILRGVPGVLGATRLPLDRSLRFARASSVYHLTGCCGDLDPVWSEAGFILLKGMEQAFEGFRASWSKLQPILESVSTMEGVESLAREQVERPPSLNLNESFPHLALAVISTRRGDRDGAIRWLTDWFCTPRGSDLEALKRPVTEFVEGVRPS